MAYSAKHRTKQVANLWKLFKEQKLCDMKFIVISGDQKRDIKAHSVFMATISPVFEKLLYANEEQKTQEKTVEIHCVNPEAFECVLRYAYCINPKVKPDNIEAVRQICDTYQISLLAAICDDCKASFEEGKIKSIRKQVSIACNNDDKVKTEWNQMFPTLNYGKYKNHNIGKESYHHSSDSDGIRKTMRSIIPKNCPLKFTFGAVDMHHYVSVKKFKFSERFEMKFCDKSLYKTQLCVEINGKQHLFWCKSIKKSALDKAMGVEVSDYIMRYRPSIVIHFENDNFLMKLSGDNVGVGFCNLFRKKHTITGHQMMHFEEKNMIDCEIEVFAKRTVADSSIELNMSLTENSKSTILFEYINVIGRAYGPSRGPSQSVDSVRQSRCAPYPPTLHGSNVNVQAQPHRNGNMYDTTRYYSDHNEPSMFQNSESNAFEGIMSPDPHQLSYNQYIGSTHTFNSDLFGAI